MAGQLDARQVMTPMPFSTIPPILDPSSTFPCGGSTPTVISVLDNATAVDQHCPTYEGDIEFLHYKSETIEMDSISKITGDLTISADAGNILGKIIFNNLTSITGTLTLGGLNDGTVLEFPALSFTGALDVSDTQLSLLDGVHAYPKLGNVASISIGRNPSLTSIALPMSSVGQLEISTSPEKSLAYPDVTFPNLTTAESITVSFINTFDAFLLETINGSATFTNTTLGNLTLNELTFVGSSFAINNPYSMFFLDLNQLKTVGNSLKGDSFSVQGSDYLVNISLPALTEVNGGMSFVGIFSEIDLPKLMSANSISVMSSGINKNSVNGSAFDCPGFFKAITAQDNNKEQITCNNQTTHSSSIPTATGSSTTLTNSMGSPTATVPSNSTSSNHHSSGLSTGAKAGIGVGAGLAVLAILAILAALILRSRSRRPKPLSELSRDQSKQLDYSPMIGGAPSGDQAQYHDTVPIPLTKQRDSHYTDIQTDGIGDGDRLGVEEGDRAVSPVSMDGGRGLGRASFESRSVSPESIDRVPLDGRM